MLVKELFQTLEEDENLVVGLMVTSQLGADDTLRVLAATFGIHYQSDDNKAALLQELESYLHDRAVEGKRVLLVVDEAQNLPKESLEELRMLSNFEYDGKPIFQIFLIGQEQLGELLNSHDMEQARQRIVAAYHLKAIDEDETKQYILFRLEKAGWKLDPNFENTVFKRIYDFTQGIPRRINTLCDRILLYGYLEEISTINLEDVNKVISEIEEETIHIEPRVADFAFQANVDQSYIQRIETLEKTVTELSDIVKKERALLRKAVLLQLDMKDTFDDTS
jgi:type II secretory pathway predicted ATPase ExeA